MIVRQHFPGPVVWLSCFAAVLFAPTVVVNSAAWGQCDSIYAAFCLGSLYFLLRQKPWWACVFFGIALSFKLQAIFFLPVLIIVLVVNRQRCARAARRARDVPLLLVPAALAGRDWASLLTIYPEPGRLGGGSGRRGRVRSASGGSAGVAGLSAAVGASATSSLTQNAPDHLPVGHLGSRRRSGSIWGWPRRRSGRRGDRRPLSLLRRRPLSEPQIVVLATTRGARGAVLPARDARAVLLPRRRADHRHGVLRAPVLAGAVVVSAARC